MNQRDKLRRIETLTYKHHGWCYTSEESFMKLYEILKNKSHQSIQMKELFEIFSLAKELNFSKQELYNLWAKQNYIRYQNKKDYNRRPQKEGRDNKDVHVGSGGSNKNKVRYPSKKRSKSTWKKFYKLFPHLAEKDGWNGVTSKRMK